MSTVPYQVKTILKEYGQGEHYDTLKLAYDEFVKLTGKCDSDSPEYEARMNCFNDWYIFNFKIDSQKSVYTKYFDINGIDSSMAESFHNVNYSIFKVIKVTRGVIHLSDILHSDNLKVAEDDSSVGLVPEDIFIGRTINFENKNYLLKGVCTLPKESLPELEKTSKHIRKNFLYNIETDLLLNIEKLKLKSLHYRHLNSKQIFNFDTFMSEFK
jgi:hypothetical protein